jgi:hypothetical protein
MKMTFHEIRIIATGPCIANQLRDVNTISLIYPPELEVKETTDTASFASFLDFYLEFDDSGQLSTKIYDKRDDFIFKIINFPNMCSGNQNSCYWPMHSESIARCKHHMQEKLVYCCTYLENL